MRYDPTLHHRRSLRLRDYDYSQSGSYFITICTYQRQCVLGEIVDGLVQLNTWGDAVQESWQRLPTHYPQMELDTFVVMPNHVHGIIAMGAPDRASLKLAPTRGTTPSVPALSEFVRAFKTFSARNVNRLRQSPGAPLWQRNFYEHIIRNDAELFRIREYIARNPARWPDDEDNPTVIPPRLTSSRHL